MTSTTDPGQKSTSEIERELEEDRARFKQTSRDLQERLSVGRLVDEALSRGRAHGPEYAGSLGRLIRDNPVPVTIIGVCLAWMMAGGQRASNGRYRYGYARRPGDGRVLGPEEEGIHPRPANRSALSPTPAPRPAPPGEAVRDHTPEGGLSAREPGKPGAAGPGTSGTGEAAQTLSERTRTAPTGAVTPAGSGSTDRTATPPPASRPIEGSETERGRHVEGPAAGGDKERGGEAEKKP